MKTESIILLWDRGTEEWKVKVGPTPDGPWNEIASGTLPDPIPLAQNETQIPLDITQLSAEVETQVGTQSTQLKIS